MLGAEIIDRPEALAVLREKKNEQNGISDIAISVTHNMDTRQLGGEGAGVRIGFASSSHRVE